MSRKSRRNRARQTVRGGPLPAPSASAPETFPAASPAPARVPFSQASRTAAKAIAADSPYIYIGSELRRIGILAGAMLVILIILVIILS